MHSALIQPCPNTMWDDVGVLVQTLEQSKISLMQGKLQITQFIGWPHMKFISLTDAGRRTVAAMALAVASVAQAAPAHVIDVYRDPNCGCCSKWIAYLRDNGFTVNDHLAEDMSPVKDKLGVPDKLMSCHTGVINGKFIEGHVPVQQIAELQRRTDLIGVAAPGMPMGSPGMETGHKSAYQIIGLKKTGEQEVVADYPSQ